MSEAQLAEILDFRRVVSMINKELHSKAIFDIEYMLVNNSIDDVIEVLKLNSTYYNKIKNCQYSNGATFSELLKVYFRYVKEKYNSLFIPNGNNNRTADKYYNKLKEPTKRNGIYLQYPKRNIDMTPEEVEKTLILMREAILAYYKVYHNKKLIAELTTNNPKNNNYFEFAIKEHELLHLLGVTANQLRNNPDFVRLTGNNNMSVTDILEWIVKDAEGNNNLVQYSEDFLKRISTGNFSLTTSQFANESQSRLLNYHKIRTKSQTFLKYGPFESVSLVVKLNNNKKLAVNSNSNTTMISRAECFRKYPWAYFGSVQTKKDKYIETLIIDTAEGQKSLLENSTATIVKGVYAEGTGRSSGGTGSSGANIFSEEEQFDLFCLAYTDFKETMDFTQLIEYFLEILNQKTNNNNLTEITSQVFTLDIDSLEMLYKDIIELFPDVQEPIYDNENLVFIYQREIINKMKYLTKEQLLDIQSRITNNQYTSIYNRKKNKK